jgi:multiple sugar transport system permease protein
MTAVTDQPSSRRHPQSSDRGSTGQGRAFQGILLAIRLALVVLFAAPILFMLVSSFKPDAQIFRDIPGWRAFVPVGDISLDNYKAMFDRVPAGRFLINSVVISAVTVTLGLIINSMAAFALSRVRWRGQKFLLSAIIATLIVPFETFALPMVWWVNQLPWLEINGFSLTLADGWLDTYRVQILPFVANAFSIFLFYQFFSTIPKELDEAARVDGASTFRIYRTIIMPLSGPAIATVAILTFLPAWNSYLWPLMVVQSEELRPVMLGIQYFYQLNVSWGQIMAYASLITVPVLALFVAFQRSFVASIAGSGVKG